MENRKFYQPILYFRSVSIFVLNHPLSLCCYFEWVMSPTPGKFLPSAPAHDRKGLKQKANWTFSPQNSLQNNCCQTKVHHICSIKLSHRAEKALWAITKERKRERVHVLKVTQNKLVDSRSHIAKARKCIWAELPFSTPLDFISCKIWYNVIKSQGLCIW